MVSCVWFVSDVNVLFDEARTRLVSSKTKNVVSKFELFSIILCSFFIIIHSLDL